MLLQISTRMMGFATVVDCSGKIVFGEETTLLRDRVKDALNANKKLVVDLTNVSYIDSSGVGTLMGLFASVQAAGGTIKLAGLTGRVKDVLVITRLATFFETYPSAEEAAGSYAGTSQAVERAS